jgi:hypothetical protein
VLLCKFKQLGVGAVLDGGLANVFIARNDFVEEGAPFIERQLRDVFVFEHERVEDVVPLASLFSDRERFSKPWPDCGTAIAGCVYRLRRK